MKLLGQGSFGTVWKDENPPGHSGYYTPDLCYCCLTCAKTEGDTCGGVWGSAGRCAPYLRCTSGYQYYAEGVCVKRIVASLEDVPLGQEIAPVC